MPRSSEPFRLGMVLFPGCMPAGLFASADFVRACNMRAGEERIVVSWVGAEGNTRTTETGPEILTDESRLDGRCDAWLLPGLWLSSTDTLDDAIKAQRPLIEALRRIPATSSVWSYCAGVALVAASGRLDGDQATATWWLRHALAERFKRVRWDGGSELVLTERCVTASGPSGYLPLMLNRLGKLFPQEVIRDVQDLLMLPIPRSRHDAFQAVEMIGLSDTSIRSLLLWAQQVPAHELTLAAAANRQNVSVRTLCRHVQRSTGLAAGDWLRRIKLAQAAEALRGTRAPVKAICATLGFATEASLYRAFRAATGMTPADYRQTYGVSARPT